MNQLALGLPPPRARKRDPETSKAAANSAKAVQVDHFNRIMAALRGCPGTIYDLAERTGLTHTQVARRLPELSEMVPPRVRPTADTRPSPSGRQCRIWEVVA